MLNKYKKQLLSNKQDNIKVGVGVDGFYSFKVTNSITNEERDLSDIIAKDHKNMILDSGLDALGNSTDMIQGCRVGTGSSPVEAGQTQLASLLGSTSTLQAFNSGSQGSEPYFTWIRYTYRFSPGQAAGNLTEIGVYSSLSGNPLFSRALIVDSANNPTVLTILSDEYLDVTYELRVYQKNTDSILSVTLYGDEYEVIARPAKITNPGSSYTTYRNNYLLYWWSGRSTYTYNGIIGSITSTPTGSNSYITHTLGPYTMGSYERTVICSYGLNDVNLSGGIRSILLTFQSLEWQLQFNPIIPKDNFKTLVLNITISWSRYNP